MTDDGYLDLPIKGRVVTQVRIVFSFGMEFYDVKDHFSIRINSAFRLKHDGAVIEIDPEQTLQCGLALGVFNCRVTSARAFESGRLELEFANGMAWSVDPDPQFEAWEANGSTGLHIVAVPGGTLGVWHTGASQSNPEIS